MASSTDYLWEEYKLLQGKVDSIGAFKFQVRGWAITLIGAFLVSGISANITPYAFLGGLAIIGMFFLIDRNQQVWQTAYVNRLAQLEVKLFSRQTGPNRYQSPAVVRTTGGAKRGLGARRQFLLVSEDLVFYGVLALITVICMIYEFLRPPPPPPQTEVRITSPVHVNLQGEPK